MGAKGASDESEQWGTMLEKTMGARWIAGAGNREKGRLTCGPWWDLREDQWLKLYSG